MLHISGTSYGKGGVWNLRNLVSFELGLTFLTSADVSFRGHSETTSQSLTLSDFKTTQILPQNSFEGIQLSKSSLHEIPKSGGLCVVFKFS